VALSLGVEWPGHEADHSPPSSAKVKECMELYLHSQYASWRGAQFKKKHQNYFIFYQLYNNQIKENEMGEACIEYGGDQKCKQNLGQEA
jgi:hypothetical protein